MSKLARNDWPVWPPGTRVVKISGGINIGVKAVVVSDDEMDEDDRSTKEGLDRIIELQRILTGENHLGRSVVLRLDEGWTSATGTKHAAGTIAVDMQEFWAVDEDLESKPS